MENPLMEIPDFLYGVPHQQARSGLISSCSGCNTVSPQTPERESHERCLLWLLASGSGFTDPDTYPEPEAAVLPLLPDI